MPVPGFDLEFLIDTGADGSFVSNEYRISHPYLSAIPLSKIDTGEVKSANDTIISVEGTIEVEFKLDNTKVVFTLIVLQKLNHNLILGMDFLSYFSGLIDTKAKIIRIDIPRNEEELLACYQLLQIDITPCVTESIKAKIALKYQIDPRTGNYLKAIVQNIPKTTMYQIGESENFRRKYPQLKLVTNYYLLDDAPTNTVELKIINTGIKTIYLYENTTVATVTECEIPVYIPPKPTKDVEYDINTNTLNGLVHHLSERDMDETLDPYLKNMPPDLPPANTREDLVKSFSLTEGNPDFQHLTNNQREELIEILYKQKEVFRQDPLGLKSTNILTADIITEHEAPIRKRPYNLSVKDKEALHKIVTDLLKLGIIKHSNSPYNFPCLVVWKTKSTGEEVPRLVVDY
jgi:predicted aspartyl protease